MPSFRQGNNRPGSEYTVESSTYSWFLALGSKSLVVGPSSLVYKLKEEEEKV